MRSPATAAAPADLDADALEAMRSFVVDGTHPCLGARSVFGRARATVREFGDLADAPAVRRLAAQLGAFADGVDLDGGFTSFVAVFSQSTFVDEAAFEAGLWQLLGDLHACERDRQSWSPAVADDPRDADFGFSFAGRPMFVVGLHPGSSRLARRSPAPALVFNLHEQFEAMRASGKYDRMREVIRARDLALQGTVNPMSADHGTVSEARQYSGRAVAADWQPPTGACPFAAERAS